MRNTGILLALFFSFQTSILLAQQLSPKDYIEKYKDAAVALMNESGCPASIILAIAMHESANGNSKIARYLNNHFGIKGKNNETRINSSYKGYERIEDSYEDFISLLQRRKQTQILFELHDHTEYESWAKGIAKSGYAASPVWSRQIIKTIEKHQLSSLDSLKNEFTQPQI